MKDIIVNEIYVVEDIIKYACVLYDWSFVVVRTVNRAYSTVLVR